MKTLNIPANLRALLGGLFDLQFKTIITTQMMPLIYGLAVVLSALASLYCVAWAFGESWWMGLVWLTLVGPALFVALITAVRVVLEFVLTVFRISCYVEAMAGQVEGIAGQTEGISDSLPRIKFWKSFTSSTKESGNAAPKKAETEK